MGNYKCRRPGYLSALQISICEAVFQGKSNEWIYKNLYKADLHSAPSVSSASKKLAHLKKNPRFIEYYESMVTEFRVHGYGKALHKLTELVDADNPWVAIQASNSVLNHTERAVINEKENQITVKIEGLPALGTPESEEQDSPQALTDGVQAVLVEAQVV